MTGIDFSLSLSRADVISGETLMLDAIVRNESPSTVRIRTSPPVPIEYELRTTDGNLRFTASALAYRRSLEAGLQLPPETETSVDLRPGESRRFRQDPALYLRQPLPPGKYLLSATLEVDGAAVQSAPLEINVNAARIRHLAFCHCALAGSMVAVFDHTDGAGRNWIFSRETSGLQLDAGVARRLEIGAEGRRIQEVAATVHVAPRLMGRWAAWLEDGSLRLVGPGAGPHPDPLPIALGQPRLVQPGFSLRDGSGVFIVAGLADGRAVMQLVTASHQRAAIAAPAALYRTLPERLLARWEEAEEGREPILRLLWADWTGGQTRLFARPYSLTGKTLAPGPKQIHARAARMLALELDPLGEDAGWAHALFEAARPDEGPVYVRVPLAGPPASPEESPLPPPPKPASDWAISGLGTGGLLVLARIEDRIWVASARGRPWQPLTAPVGEIRHLRLAASRYRYWGAFWADPASGLRWASDPEYRARY